MTKQKSKLTLFILFFIFSGSIFFPTVTIGSMGVRFSDILSLCFLPLLLFGWPKIHRMSKSTIIFFLFILSTVISLIHSYILLDVPSIIRDFNEILRYIILFFVLFFTSNISYTRISYVIHFFFQKTYLIFFLFGILQRFFFSYIPTPLLRLWGGEAHVNALLISGLRRIFITGSDPNIGAVIVSLYLFYFFSEYIYGNKIRNLIKVFMMCLLMVFTSSRTVLIGTCCIISFYFMTSKDIKINRKLIFFIIIIISSFVIYLNTPYLSVGLSSLLEGNNNSVLVRLNNFKESIDLFVQSPILGWGPAKSIHRTVADGEYFLILRRYGLVGIIFYIILFIYGLKLSKKNKETQIGLIAFLYFRLGLFIMITNNLISGYQLGIPFVILLGFLESYEKNKD